MRSVFFTGAHWYDPLAFAMTVSCPDHQNGLLRNFESFSPYRHGSSTALVMPIRNPVTMSGFFVRACSAIGGASSGKPLCASVMPSASVSLPGPEHSDRSSCNRRRRRGLHDERLLCSGPGKLTEALGITDQHNGLPLDAPPIALYARTKKPDIVTGVRIGITKAVELPWRYGLKGSKFLSKPF